MKLTLLIYNPKNTVLVDGLRYFGLPIDILRGARTQPEVVKAYPKDFIILFYTDDNVRQMLETTVEGYTP